MSELLKERTREAEAERDRLAAPLEEQARRVREETISRLLALVEDGPPEDRREADELLRIARDGAARLEASHADAVSRDVLPEVRAGLVLDRIRSEARAEDLMRRRTGAAIDADLGEPGAADRLIEIDREESERLSVVAIREALAELDRPADVRDVGVRV